MGQVLVAHAAGDADIAARVVAALAAEKLDAGAFEGAPSTKADKARFDAAAVLVLIWSRRAAAEPALQREANAAAARRTLVLARQGGASAPARFRASLAIAVAATGRGPHRLARAVAARLSQPKPRTKAMTADPTGNVSTWKGTLLLAVLLGGIAWSAAWVSLGSSPAPFLLSLLKG